MLLGIVGIITYLAIAASVVYLVSEIIDFGDKE